MTVTYLPESHEAFDKLTKEPVEITARKYTPRYQFKGGHRTVGVIATFKLLRYDLTKNQMKVAIWLPLIARPGNLVSVSGAAAEQVLGIERHLFSRIMSKLVDLDLIRRDARGVFALNPHYAWNGSAADHKTALAEWDLRKRLVVEMPLPERKRA